MLKTWQLESLQLKSVTLLTWVICTKRHGTEVNGWALNYQNIITYQLPHIIQTLISFFSIFSGFEPEDITGNPPKNMMDRDSSIDSNLSNNTGKDRPARKSTIHDLYASREKHRAKSVKACRATAEQIIHNSNTKISNMDVLFRHEVSKTTTNQSFFTGRHATDLDYRGIYTGNFVHLV